MRNSLLKLGTPAALIVFGSCVGFVACGSHPWDQYDPYTPFKIFVDSVEARGQLTVEDNEELFFLNKGNELILEIPKYEEVGVRGLTILGKLDKYSDATLPLHERMAIDHFIRLSSNNPNVWLCRAIIINENTPVTECNSEEIITQTPIIDVDPRNLEDLATAAGVLNQAVAVTILHLELDGNVDDQPFLIRGRVIYDNTEQSRSAYDERIKAGPCA